MRPEQLMLSAGSLHLAATGGTGTINELIETLPTNNERLVDIPWPQLDGMHSHTDNDSHILLAVDSILCQNYLHRPRAHLAAFAHLTEGGASSGHSFS